MFLGLIAGLGLLNLEQLIILAGEMMAVNNIGMFTLYRLERLRRQEYLNLNQIAAERTRYYDLLVRILPASIAERMRGGEQHIADCFDEASVLFIDIAGFTSLSAKLQPEEVLSLLERAFAKFDTLVEKHGLEKIKTIGDAYLVAAGVIGESRFLYDMWGDTVNVASRMESLGETGKIQVSDDARERLKELFVLAPRGVVSVKGRGEMQTWWLTGRK